jgi:hypothetical protein
VLIKYFGYNFMPLLKSDIPDSEGMNTYLIQCNCAAGDREGSEKQERENEYLQNR